MLFCWGCFYCLTCCCENGDVAFQNRRVWCSESSKLTICNPVYAVLSLRCSILFLDAQSLLYTPFICLIYGIPFLSNVADEYCGLFLRFWSVEGVSLSFGVCYLILTYFDTCYCHFSNLLLFLLRMVMVFSRKWPGHQEQSNRTVSFKLFNCYWLFDLINLCCDILTRVALVFPQSFWKGYYLIEAKLREKLRVWNNVKHVKEISSGIRKPDRFEIWRLGRVPRIFFHKECLIGDVQGMESIWACFTLFCYTGVYYQRKKMGCKAYFESFLMCNFISV